MKKKMSLANKKTIEIFLRESNAIEAEHSELALHDAQDAFKFALRNRHKMSLEVILEIHRRLMRRLDPLIAGKLRRHDIWIGGHIKMFISEELLKEEIMMWLVKYRDVKTEEEIKEAHIEFEGWHGFYDGNGRIGRILMAIQFINVGLPIWIIHRGKEQLEYYKMFR